MTGVGSKMKRPSFRRARLKKIFLARKILFIESTDGEKILARGEEECARAKIKREIEDAKNPNKNSRPSRHPSADENTSAATSATFR